ncbi:MAG TPA: glycerophosphodiester phosphodiesterase [Anaerolineae bacterium]|nr:glycerophosphodiester phosphodiesterase [Anaerolineae bacterium]
MGLIHNIAHRGASAYEPENTLRAFARAIEMGASLLELDLHLSRDGHLIVLHDADLSRTTNGVGRVAEWDLASLRRLDAGGGQRLPLLAEVIELARGRVGLYLELKGPGTPGPVVQRLRTHRFREAVIIGSFSPLLLREVKALDTTLRTSLLVGWQDRADLLDHALSLGADFVHPCWERASATPHKLLTSAWIAALRRRGLGIILWHEERPAELRELIKLDVDGICTNTPDLLADLLRRREMGEVA